MEIKVMCGVNSYKKARSSSWLSSGEKPVTKHVHLLLSSDLEELRLVGFVFSENALPCLLLVSMPNFEEFVFEESLFCHAELPEYTDSWCIERCLLL
jgi:hypothetical protein